MNVLTFPELSLILLVGPSSAGKSTLAKRLFGKTEVLSSDYCRALVCDDENDQTVTKEAFEVLRFLVTKRLEKGRLTVVDATNLRPEDRRVWVQLARTHHFLPAIIAVNTPESVCAERNGERADRKLVRRVIRSQCQMLKKSLQQFKREGFRTIHVIGPDQDHAEVTIERQPMWSNHKHVHGPFDIIGDVHGCFDELLSLLGELGWELSRDDAGTFHASHPQQRQLVFVGDLADRGPKNDLVLSLVMDLCAEGSAHCVPGNHEAKLLKHLRGRKTQVSHGLAETLEQIAPLGKEFGMRLGSFIDSLVSHRVFDEGKLVVAHAGLKEPMQGRGSAAVRSFCLYGDTTGETDEFGLPVRYPWAEEYRGSAMVVYGHTPVPEAEWLNNTVCIDTGCVFGGSLTALRYPERELVSVPAQETYFAPAKPLRDESIDGGSAQQQSDRLLHLDDVFGKRLVRTRYGRYVTIRSENAAPALEVMSRFAVQANWLIYLPPTMSPSSTSEREGYLEHPENALADLRSMGATRVVAEEKHMGSRAVVVLCKNQETVRERFGVQEERLGVCYTRTGRPFFRDDAVEAQLLARLHKALTSAGMWEDLGSDWFCLDTELLPWSAKARDLLVQQYGAVAAAGEAGLGRCLSELSLAMGRGAEVEELHERFQERAVHVGKFREAYGHYCWDVDGAKNLKLAPFHLLASEGCVHDDKDHIWHMAQFEKLAAQDPEFLVATPHRCVNLDSTAECQGLVDWWEDLTQRGGEGLVLKPLDFVSRNRKGLQQPALKCRGPEYLRIIYGPEYREEPRLRRLRKRGLSRKRSLALREFSLGLEGLHRFVERAPLREIHECVFAVLALESEAVDPRL